MTFQRFSLMTNILGDRSAARATCQNLKQPPVCQNDWIASDGTAAIGQDARVVCVDSQVHSLMDDFEREQSCAAAAQSAGDAIGLRDPTIVCLTSEDCFAPGVRKDNSIGRHARFGPLLGHLRRGLNVSCASLLGATIVDQHAMAIAAAVLDDDPIISNLPPSYCNRRIMAELRARSSL